MAKEYKSLQDFQEYMMTTNAIEPDKIKYHGDSEHTSSIYNTTEICSKFTITNENTNISVAFIKESGKLFDIQINE